MAVRYKGGKCRLCGYKKYIGALEFHHPDPVKKDFGLSTSGLTRSRDRTRKELDKCIMLYANCHREVHAGITQLPTETLVEKRGELSRNSGIPF